MSGMSNGLFIRGVVATGISSMMLPFVVEVPPTDDADEVMMMLSGIVMYICI